MRDRIVCVTVCRCMRVCTCVCWCSSALRLYFWYAKIYENERKKRKTDEPQIHNRQHVKLESIVASSEFGQRHAFDQQASGHMIP